MKYTFFRVTLRVFLTAGLGTIAHAHILTACAGSPSRAAPPAGKINSEQPRTDSISAAPLPRSPSGSQTAQARPANGTYTFWPRIQGYRGAAKAPAFIVKIVVRGEYMSIFLTGTAQGPAESSIPEPDFRTIALPRERIILQDLDNPGKTYNPETKYEFEDDVYYFPFKGVTTRRFSLTNTYSTIPTVFEEIIIGEPDAQ
jgi:hypothetical protein